MPAPQQQVQTSRLDRILLHLGVLSQKMDEVKAGTERVDGKQELLEHRVRDMERDLAVVQAGSKTSIAIWLFVWQALGTVVVVGFTIAEFLHGR